MDMIAAQPVGRPRQFNGGNTLAHLFQQNSHLQPGNMSTEAEVRSTLAEGHVIIWPAIDDETMRVVELGFIPVARGKVHCDFVACFDMCAGGEFPL